MIIVVHSKTHLILIIFLFIFHRVQSLDSTGRCPLDINGDTIAIIAKSVAPLHGETAEGKLRSLNTILT